jgi:hypothetical protein
MAQANDLTPPIDASVEFLNIGWDFGKILGPTVTITSVQSIVCSNHLGSPIVDPSPASRLIGGSSIITSLASGLPSQAVGQQIGNCIAGVVYTLLCVVNTSDSQKPSIWTRYACKAVT